MCVHMSAVVGLYVETRKVSMAREGEILVGGGSNSLSAAAEKSTSC